MDLTNGTPQLVMELTNLSSLPPEVAVPGYTLRTFQPGDEPGWVSVADACFGGEHEPSFFYERFNNLPFEAWRVGFAEGPDGLDATVTAWFRAKWGPHTGYLHWLGVKPTARGHHLGYAICLAALHRMAGEGRTSAVLETDDTRLPAIHIYLKLGIIPRLVDDNQRERWPRIFAAMGVDPAPYADILAGPLRPPLPG